MNLLNWKQELRKQIDGVSEYDNMVEFITNYKKELLTEIKNSPWCDLENGRGKYLLESMINHLMTMGD